MIKGSFTQLPDIKKRIQVTQPEKPSVPANASNAVMYEIT